jgi:hypothetical protein
MMYRLAASWMLADVLLCVAVGAFAQSNAISSGTPTAAETGAQADRTAPSDPPVVRSAIISSDGRIVTDGGEDDEQIQKMIRAQQERNAQLRKQLADPKQGRQIRAERVRQARAQHPEVVRVLRLDGKAEQQLFAQLAEEILALELRPSPFSRAGMVRREDIAQENREEVKRHTQRMQQIANAIGAARLDDFVDYERSFQERGSIERFDRTLPANRKLTGEQRDAMVPLLQESQRRLYSSFRRSSVHSGSTVSMSQAERDRLATIALSEQSTNEVANRELLERLAAILDAEQLQAFARLKQQEFESWHARDRQRRRELGIAPDEKLEALYDDSSPLPPPSTSVNLVVRIGVDGEFVDKTLTGVRGMPVTVELPKGLVLEIRRLPSAEQMVLFEAEVFELIRGGRRQVASLGTTGQALGPEYARLAQAPTSTSVALGRKGYLIEHRISGITP